MPLKNLQLAAVFEYPSKRLVLRFPLRRELQEELAKQWSQQLDEFLEDTKRIAFDPGYSPEQDEAFEIKKYELPDWLAGSSSLTAPEFDSVSGHERDFNRVSCVMVFARDESDEELILFQNFVRSHIIQPGFSLFLSGDTYVSPEKQGLTLDRKLTAIYYLKTRRLLFKNFRATNTFLPLTDYFSEASEKEIREVLCHRIIAPESVAGVDALATRAPQWFRKRFAMLRASGLLDGYTAAQIKTRSVGYDIDVKVRGEKIVFPDDKSEAKKLLQFLNEEIFRGAITETLYETNSKRQAAE